MCPSSITSSKGPGSSGDGLVTVTSDRPVAPVTAWCVIILFLGIIVGTGCIDSIAPVPLPLLTGLERRQEDQRIKNARIIDGSRARLIEHHQRLRSRVRAAVSPEYSFALHRWFHEVKPSVIYGKEGWLFLKSRVIPAKPVDQVTLARIADGIAFISDRIAESGSRLILLPIPRKAVFCSKYLPDWVRTDIALDSTFISLLQQRGIPTVNMFEFIETDGISPPYYKRGSHWIPSTQILVAEELCKTAGIWAPAQERNTEIVFIGERVEEFSVLEYAGVGINRRIENILKTTTTPYFRVENKRGIPDLHDVSRTERSICLFGTSFSAGSFHHFLRHFSRYNIRNMAHRGTNPFESFGDFIKDLPPAPHGYMFPDVIIIEFPIHQLFISLEREFATLHEFLNPAQTEMRTLFDVEIEPKFIGGRYISNTPVRIAHVRDTIPEQPDNGLTGILFSGELTGGDVILVSRSGSDRSRVIWREGQTEIFFPLIDMNSFPLVTFSIRSTKSSGERVLVRINKARMVQFTGGNPSNNKTGVHSTEFSSKEKQKLSVSPPELLYGRHVTDGKPDSSGT